MYNSKQKNTKLTTLRAIMSLGENLPFHILSYADSDKGRRANNEDYITFYEPSDPKEQQVSGCIYIVADGVGGTSSGERASSFAAKKVLYEYKKHPEVEPALRLKQAIAQANQEIFEFAENKDIRMATTMTVAVVIGNTLIVANVGDSRVYLIRKNDVKQVTRDHNIVGELVRDNIMTEEEALRSKAKNKLTRSIGGNDEVRVDVFGPIELFPDDRILLCSDGLTRYTLKKDIATLTDSSSPEEIVKNSIAFAKKQGHGGADNISVIAVIYSPTLSSNIDKRPEIEISKIPRSESLGRFHDGDEETNDLGRSQYEDIDVTELESPNIETLAMLWVKEGRRRGRTYPIKHGTVIGRNQGNLLLDDPKVSSIHAKFNMEGENLVVWDFGSANGTFVNEKRIRNATVLQDNDLVKIGETVFVIKLLLHENRSITPAHPKPNKNKKLRISVAYPKLISKGNQSTFLFSIYLSGYHSEVERNIQKENLKILKNYKDPEKILKEQVTQDSPVKPGQRIKVEFTSHAFHFTKNEIYKEIDQVVNEFRFSATPTEVCKEGIHDILILISDAKTGFQIEAINIQAKVVDYAFDHVSRPLLSRVLTVFLGFGSFAMYLLTFLEQIDKTIGLTSGTAAGVLAITIYASLYNLYQRLRLNAS